MPAQQIEITVEMESGDTWDVVGDQRDLAKWEVQDFHDPSRLITMTRFIAWSASLRQQKTKLSWEKFNAQCVEARDMSPEDEDLDPTKPDQSGDNS